ncbi:MAG: hypothetical protein ABR556_12875 [Pyrinomonadaceae bacterium]
MNRESLIVERVTSPTAYHYLRFTIYHLPVAMTPKEIAAQYEAKVFDTPEAAKVAGFVLTETLAPRNVWNKASAAQAIVTKLATKRTSGEATEIGLIIEPWSVTGCYVPAEPAPAAA